MNGFGIKNNQKGSILLETSVSIGVILFIIAGATNLGSIIWEATIFTEVNRSASRYSTMQTYNRIHCGESSQTYKNFVKEMVMSYMGNYRENNSSSGRNSWETTPHVDLRTVSYPRSGIESSDGAQDMLSFDYSIVTILNKPDLSCKFCSSFLNQVFTMSTSSLFMLPCALSPGLRSSSGNNPGNETPQNFNPDDQNAEDGNFGGYNPVEPGNPQNPVNPNSPDIFGDGDYYDVGELDTEQPRGFNDYPEVGGDVFGGGKDSGMPTHEDSGSFHDFTTEERDLPDGFYEVPSSLPKAPKDVIKGETRGNSFDILGPITTLN